VDIEQPSLCKLGIRYIPVKVVVELVVAGHGDKCSPGSSHAVEQLHRGITPRLQFLTPHSRC